MAGLATAKDVPYFDGDFWPNTLEEAIVEEEKEKNMDDPVDPAAEQLEASIYTPCLKKTVQNCFCQNF